MSSATKLKQIKAQRQLCLDRVHSLAAVAQSALSDKNMHSMFRVRYNDIDEFRQQFKKHHENIIDAIAITDDPDFAAESAFLQKFDDLVYNIKSVHFDLFEKNASSKTDVPEEHKNNVKSSVKLRKFDVPQFDGNIRDWPTFIDLFTSMIHNNDGLSNSEKFQFLITSLSKNPLSIVKTVKLTDSNYPIAFKALKDRYQNPRWLANTYWQEIVDFPKIKPDSPASLRDLLDCVSENLEALKQLKLPIDQWSFVLFNLIMKKLDQATITRYELENASTEIPSYEHLKIFLSKQCTALETVSLATSSGAMKIPAKSNNNNNNWRKPGVTNKVHSSCFVAEANTSNNCQMCSASHPLYRCSLFLEKPPFDRYQFVKEKNLCLNCLQSSSHRSSACQMRQSCKICHFKHHSLLHYVSNTSKPSSPALVSNPTCTPSISTSLPIPSRESSVVNSLTNVISSNNTVLLSTLLVELQDGDGNFQTVRALLDCASQSSFITENCFRRLGLTRDPLDLSVNGLDSLSLKVKGVVYCTIRPRGQVSPQLTVNAAVIPKICSTMPSTHINISNFAPLANLKLSDPNWNIPNGIELLLAADIFPLILTAGLIPGNESQPTAINTVFGWILMGKLSHLPSTHINSFCTVLDTSLDNLLKRFWEVEQVPQDITSCPEDVQCETAFAQNYFRDDTGRFTVALPFKANEPFFRDSRSVAVRRFCLLEKRLLCNPSLYQSYSDFMKDYLDCGHMIRVSAGSDSKEPTKVYYIPHFCVMKPESPTTKLRVVFDASCKIDNVSLNDTLLAGPKLQKDITAILLKFRLHKIVFTADIRQMYRQILIVPDHQEYQRIVWRFSPSESIQDFKLTTVTYGVSSSPFLALRCVLQLAEDEKQNFPEASKALLSDIFVDDIVTGSDTLQSALELQRQLIDLLGRGGFELRKFASNHSNLLNFLPIDYCHQHGLTFENEENMGIKILGLKWLPTFDCFTYSVESLNRPCNKRTVLSELARIFDPLGFLAPISFFVKHLIQCLWSLGLDWDEQPSPGVLKCWSQFKDELHLLSTLHVPRCFNTSTFSQCDLHGFCDSSEKGYGAVVYLRFVNSNGEITTTLVCAKTKVAPLKKLTLPRLELCGAVLLSNLLSFILKVFSEKLVFARIFAWTDSSIALSWIRSPSYRWQTFVSNRVSYIQDKVSSEHWHHVQSADNPADCASRGLMPSQLINHHLWWSGPSWLRDAEQDWPDIKISSDDNLQLEEEKILCLSTGTSVDSINGLLEKFSSLEKIKRIIAYCYRFVYNLKNHPNKRAGAFNQFELQEALMPLVKYCQSIAFKNELDSIIHNRPTSKSFRKLTPFLDQSGILRVGGRLINSDLPFETKHPILLPRHSRLTTLIIEDLHKHHLHAGLQTLQYLLVQNFWVLSSKRAIKNVLSKCYRCFRINPKYVQPIMGNLPSYRVSQLKPFSCVGVDFGGPFVITMGRVRGAKTLKAYLCLFVCFATKALHLELASDLSSEAFLAALRRFIARRGRCSKVFSDCGTNFVGANRYITELMQSAVESEKLEWSFNAPSSPHFGGLWEAGIKSVKSHLLRVIGDQILTYEELSTVFTQIEAVLNSRPICALSSDPSDLCALTPGHFLTLEPLTSLPDPDVTHLKLNRLARWQLLQRLHQEFWKRWHREYLHTLMQRNKWNHSADNVLAGTLVVIRDEVAPPLKWRLGRVIKVHPGTDGVVRVASVKVGTGIIQRPIVKLCPLPNIEK